MFNFNTTYTSLPEELYSYCGAAMVAKPSIAMYNKDLANTLEIKKMHEDDLPMLLSGNKLIPDCKPFAQAYSGHQFGHFAMLGDGRALLLGEHVCQNKRYDVQLKGSGPTPYSRRGDGRATLSAMLREYIISEAMHYLKIPTTRSLAVVISGQPVMRENAQVGAILTRIAQSHIRVGTFEYAATLENKNVLQQLTAYTLQRHYTTDNKNKNAALCLLENVIEQQASLISKWMNVGFIHGVMNTDNMSIAGETIDYGPCAFMNQYNINTVYSSIDTQSRYAYGNQPYIAQWNIMCLANALLPLLHEQQNKAIEIAQEVLNSFATIYTETWQKVLVNKIGLDTINDATINMAQQLLNIMQDANMDYTNTFYFLSKNELPIIPEYKINIQLQAWYNKWIQIVDMPNAIKIMQSTNPCIIPRNNLVEEALNLASTENDFSKIHNLLNTLKEPYNYTKHTAEPTSYTDELTYKTYCNT
jgi:serine/tyrosine/threonine adenylyltransferase